MKGIYRGPGDFVSLDGVEFKKGETVTVTAEQITRIRTSDPEAVFDITSEKGDDAAVVTAQDKMRRAAEKES